MKIVLASGNLGKVREFQSLFAEHAIQLVPQSDFALTDIEETGSTFVENALLKARHAALKTGLPAIADDSGLVVPALNGAPGIYSARYAGRGANAALNIDKLLSDLKDIDDEKRGAVFHCVLVYLAHPQDPAPLICDGQWTGSILKEPRGTMGFGYDPIFYVPSQQKTAAQLPLELKNRISHRGQAIHSLLNQLRKKI